MRREQVHACRQLANRVERYHTWPTLHRQTTGEHANRVLQIYVEIFGLPRAEVLYYISIHDAGEQFASDVQFGAKRRVPELKRGVEIAEGMGLRMLGVQQPELTLEERVKFKICDLLEMWEFGHVEKNMGSRYAAPVIMDTQELAFSMARELPGRDDEQRVAAWIQRQAEIFGG